VGYPNLRESKSGYTGVWRGTSAPPPCQYITSYRNPYPLKTDSPANSHKSIIDSLLLKIPSVEAGDMSGLPAYFINRKMFACIHGSGVALRLPASTATELQFSRDNVVPFQPNGRPSSREWVQINHDDSADYTKDLELFQSSIDFVKAAKAR
jgi:hypothetical protein